MACAKYCANHFPIDISLVARLYLDIPNRKEVKIMISEKRKDYSSKKIQNQTDAYIAGILGMPVKLARQHPDLIEIKRATILLNRSLRNKAE
jgi:hypothetical protein